MTKFKSSTKISFYLFFALLLWLGARNVFALELTFQGRILFKKNSIYFVDQKSKTTFELDFSSDISKKQISRLTQNDFISFTGAIDSANKNVLQVNSLNYVGLDWLIGNWKSPNNTVYSISSFTKLSVMTSTKMALSPYDDLQTADIAPFVIPKKQFNLKPGIYNYFISPDVKEWNLLISSEAGDFFAELHPIDKDHVEIKLFDGQSDAILGIINLRR